MMLTHTRKLGLNELLKFGSSHFKRSSLYSEEECDCCVLKMPVYHSSQFSNRLLLWVTRLLRTSNPKVLVYTEYKGFSNGISYLILITGMITFLFNGLDCSLWLFICFRRYCPKKIQKHFYSVLDSTRWE